VLEDRRRPTGPLIRKRGADDALRVLLASSGVFL